MASDDGGLDLQSLGLNLGAVPKPQSGHDKRRARNELPQMFFVSSGSGASRWIVGLITVVAVRAWGGDTSSVGDQFEGLVEARRKRLKMAVSGRHRVQHVVWEIGNAAALQHPFSIGEGDYDSMGLVFPLRPAAEMKLMRALVATIGGLRLGDVLPAMVDPTLGAVIVSRHSGFSTRRRRIRCFQVASLELAKDICDSKTTTVLTPSAYCLAAGVPTPLWPERAQPSSTAPLAIEDGESRTPLAPLADVEDASGEGCESGEEQLSDEKLPPVLGEYTVASAMLQTTIQVVPRQLSAKYKVQVLLRCMALWRACKGRIALSDIAKSVLRMLFRADVANGLVNLIDRGRARLPSYETMRKASIKLDMFAMWWQRFTNTKHHVVNYLYVDSSPQGGYDFMVTKCDELWLPSSMRGLQIGPGVGLQQDFLERSADHQRELWRQRLGIDLQSSFVSGRTMPVSVCGRGASGLMFKVANLIHVAKLENDSDEQFRIWRWSVRGFCTDMGTEGKLADVPLVSGDSLSAIANDLVTFVEGDSPSPLLDYESYLFPNCIWWPDMMHILYNGLEESLKHLECWKRVEVWLRKLTNFLSTKSLRQRAMRLLCTNSKQRACLEHYSSVHIDFKWEFLTKCLDQLLPVLPTLMEVWNKSRFHAGCDHRGSDDDLYSMSALVVGVDDALQSPLLIPLLEQLRVVAKAVDKAAGFCEGCACHAEVWLGPQRSRMQGGAALTCFWKGCRGPELVLAGHTPFLQWINMAGSERLSAALCHSEDEDRATVLQAGRALKARLSDILQHKMSFMQELPYKALGIFAGELDGSLAEAAKVCARECRGLSPLARSAVVLSPVLCWPSACAHARAIPPDLSLWSGESCVGPLIVHNLLLPPSPNPSEACAPFEPRSRRVPEVGGYAPPGHHPSSSPIVVGHEARPWRASSPFRGGPGQALGGLPCVVRRASRAQPGSNFESEGGATTRPSQAVLRRQSECHSGQCLQRLEGSRNIVTLGRPGVLCLHCQHVEIARRSCCSVFCPSVREHWCPNVSYELLPPSILGAFRSM